MAFLKFKNIRIAGFSAGVPKNIIVNDFVQSKDYNAEDFVATTGVKQRRVSTEFTTSDLCSAAAEKLLQDLGWDKSEVEALIFVSQTADYILPATACVLQERLGLGKECYALDIALGCSGWVYGLSTVVSLLGGGTIKRALLLAGDAKKRAAESSDPLFGHSGTVTAVEYKEGEEDFCFHFGTDGSGFDAIITPDGGSRNPFTPESLKLEEVEGQMVHRLQTRMKGMDVFSFGITTAPRSVRKLAEHYELSLDSYDYFVFHQANKMMNEMIRKKLKLSEEKVPYSLGEFGNTSSASIPMTIVTQLKGKVENRETRFICCGFGVGLSWGTVAFNSKKLVISDLVEL